MIGAITRACYGEDGKSTAFAIPTRCALTRTILTYTMSRAAGVARSRNRAVAACISVYTCTFRLLADTTTRTVVMAGCDSWGRTRSTVFARKALGTIATPVDADSMLKAVIWTGCLDSTRGTTPASCTFALAVVTDASAVTIVGARRDPHGCTTIIA